ncbi:radical SAM protein [Thermoproteota archaeon]
MNDSIKSLVDDMAKQANYQAYNPKMWVAVTTYACPYSCNHCFFGSNIADQTHLNEEVLDRFAHYANLNAEYFNISGGEPMLNPEQVFRTLRNTRTPTTKLSSTFLGWTEEEVKHNIAMLRNAGLDELQISITTGNYHTHPKKIELPYTDYVAFIMDEILKADITLSVRSLYDVNNTKLLVNIGEEIMRGKLGAGKPEPDPINVGNSFISEKDGKLIYMTLNHPINVGRARDQDCDIDFDMKYICPAMETRMLMGGALTLYPDGNTARCCSVERGADFGYGNANEIDFPEIINNIQNNPLLDINFRSRLITAHMIMKEEFPELLPKNGAKEPCEVCSPMVSNPEVKKRLKEISELFEGCF